MAERFILRDILVVIEAGLMVTFGARADGTSVPDGYIISTGEAVVVVVEPFVFVRGTCVRGCDSGDAVSGNNGSRDAIICSDRREWDVIGAMATATVATMLAARWCQMVSRDGRCRK